MAAKPATGLTVFGSSTTGTTTQLDNNFTAITGVVNDLNSYANYLTDTGGLNAYSASLPSSTTGALTAGLRIQFKPSATNTGASTFNWNGGGAVNILRPSGSALSAGDIVSTGIADIQYNGTNWILLNATAGGGGSSYPGFGASVFTANGTFTIPANITTLKITVVGGGGSGANGSGGCACVPATPGAGGGGGGAAIKYLTGVTPGNTLAVTVGGAGSSSQVASGTQVITTVSATAGSNASTTTGGSGGIGSNGDLSIGGGGGGSSITGNLYAAGAGGAGGSSILGGGGRGAVSAAGSVGRAYGGGGSGGAAGSSYSGAAGASGVVIIEY